MVTALCRNFLWKLCYASGFYNYAIVLTSNVYDACVCVYVCVWVCECVCVCVLFICIVQRNWACLTWKSMCVSVCVLFICVLQHNWACLTWKSAIEIKSLLVFKLIWRFSPWLWYDKRLQYPRMIHYVQAFHSFSALFNTLRSHTSMVNSFKESRMCLLQTPTQITMLKHGTINWTRWLLVPFSHTDVNAEKTQDETELLLLLHSPAISLGFSILSKIFVYVTIS